jgi:hypothetical protein
VPRAAGFSKRRKGGLPPQLIPFLSSALSRSTPGPLRPWSRSARSWSARGRSVAVVGQYNIYNTPSGMEVGRSVAVVGGYSQYSQWHGGRQVCGGPAGHSLSHSCPTPGSFARSYTARLVTGVIRSHPLSPLSLAAGPRGAAQGRSGAAEGHGDDPGRASALRAAAGAAACLPPRAPPSGHGLRRRRRAHAAAAGHGGSGGGLRAGAREVLARAALARWVLGLPPQPRVPPCN